MTLPPLLVPKLSLGTRRGGLLMLSSLIYTITQQKLVFLARKFGFLLFIKSDRSVPPHGAGLRNPAETGLRSPVLCGIKRSNCPYNRNALRILKKMFFLCISCILWLLFYHLCMSIYLCGLLR